MSEARSIAVVTGGAKRLGRHLCSVLGTRGYGIVVLYRSSHGEAAEVVKALEVAGISARALQADVGVRAQVERAFADIGRVEGRVDLLVNNVGNYNPQHLTDLTPEEWESCLAANLSGAFYASYHALRLMPDGGQILNIGTSGLGCRADESAVDYFVSKSGLLTLTRSMAKAYAGRGIRTNMISPGHLVSSIDLPPDLAAAIPLGRAGRLEDVSQAVEFLLDADYVTGINLEVAGGFRL